MSIRAILISAICGASVCLPIVFAESEPDRSREEMEFLDRFNAAGDTAVKAEFRATEEFGLGRPHPQAPEGLKAGFGQLVGSYDCKSVLPAGINRFRPDERLVAPFRWDWYYTLNGRAVGDRWFTLNSVGEQIRTYEPDQNSWDIVWVSISNIALGQPVRVTGAFTGSRLSDGNLQMVRDSAPAGISNASLTKILFYEIDEDGFKWKSQSYTSDGEPTGPEGNISCSRSKRTSLMQ